MVTARHTASGGDRPLEADGAHPARGHVMHHRVLGCTPQVVSVTVHLPDDLRHAVQALVSHDGDTTTVILRAVEEYIVNAAKKRGDRFGKYRDLAQALSTPVTNLRLSARPASALQMLNIKYVYELVQQSPTDLFGLPNVGKTSLREVKEKVETERVNDE